MRAYRQNVNRKIAGTGLELSERDVQEGGLAGRAGKPQHYLLTPANCVQTEKKNKQPQILRFAQDDSSVMTQLLTVG
jgi:hypothetical protein